MDNASGGPTQPSDKPATAPETSPPQVPVKNKGGGGKKGARKPSKILRAMRWVSENKFQEGEKLNPLRQMYRDLQTNDLIEFTRQLGMQERALASRRSPPPTPSTSAPKADGSSSITAQANGSSGPTVLDKGEMTVLEAIDKLLAGYAEEEANASLCGSE